MRFVLFSTTTDSAPRVGLIDGDAVRPLDEFASLESLIGGGESARRTASQSVAPGVPLREVTLRAPLRPHKNVFCVGRNYLAHAEEGARARGQDPATLKLPTVPTFFTKAPTAIADPESTLELDGRVSKEYDWEAELGVVIGTRCKNVPEQDALSVIFGYTCVNDISARDLQRATPQWFKGKTLDGTCPLGPLVVTADEIGDPQRLEVSCRVNGETKQHAPTSAMIFSVARIIAELSKGLTLEPGDVIATGTPEGVGFARTPPEFLNDGDVVEVDVSGIGVLRNRIALAAHVPA